MPIRPAVFYPIVFVVITVCVLVQKPQRSAQGFEVTFLDKQCHPEQVINENRSIVISPLDGDHVRINTADPVDLGSLSRLLIEILRTRSQRLVYLMPAEGRTFGEVARVIDAMKLAQVDRIVLVLPSDLPLVHFGCVHLPPPRSWCGGGGKSQSIVDMKPVSLWPW